MREDLLLDDAMCVGANHAIIAAHVTRWRHAYGELCRLESALGKALRRPHDPSALEELRARMRASQRHCDQALAELSRAVSAKRSGIPGELLAW